MANHESPPEVCPGCIKAIHSMLDRREQVDYYYCEHFETLALIVLFVAGGGLLLAVNEGEGVEHAHALARV